MSYPKITLRAREAHAQGAICCAAAGLDLALAPEVLYDAAKAMTEPGAAIRYEDGSGKS